MTSLVDGAHGERGHGAAVRGGAVSAARVGCVVVGAAIALDGLGLLLLAVSARAGVLPKGVELLLRLVVLIPGLLITRTGIAGRYPLELGVFPGELVLAGALLYLGVAMPVFHAGGVSYSAGLGQFLGVLVGLFLGSAGLALSGASTPPHTEASGVYPPAALRDSVLLIVGTIVVAIALSQLGMAKLTPPKWNWISFAGITVPGMLILIGREFFTQAYRPHHRGSRPPLLRLLLTELLLVVGLAVMLYGSGANLTLGKNGYTTGIKNNTDGLALLIAAAVFLVVFCGLLSPSPSAAHGRAAVRLALARNVAYAVGAIAFIYGERSVIMGKGPVPSFGAALPGAAAILLAGLLILIVGRLVARSNTAAASAEPARQWSG